MRPLVTSERWWWCTGRTGSLLAGRCGRPSTPFGEVRGNLEPFMRVCEQLDERAELRQRVVTDQDWRDRIGLRALDAQIGDALADLGIRSTLPAARIVKDNDWTVELASVIGPGGTDHLTADRDE